MCLVARNLREMIKAWVDAHLNNVPAYLVVDSGCANFFNGQPTVTALGIGPCPTAHFLRRLKLQQ